MDEASLAAQVAFELEALSANGAELHSDSASATINLFDAQQSVLRITDFAIEYMALQSGIGHRGLAAVVTAGPPAAGKSTELKESGLDGPTWRDIDADVAKELILRRAIAEGTYDEFLSWELVDGRPIRPLELASLVHRESSIVASNVLEACLRLGENVVVQGTLAWQDQPYKLLDSLDTHGYDDLTILSVEAELSTAIAQSRDRWWRDRANPEKELGGRFVPESLISDLYLPNGSTKCSTNARFMFELSNLPTAKIVTTSTVGGNRVRHERVKIEGQEVTPPTEFKVERS